MSSSSRATVPAALLRDTAPRTLLAADDLPVPVDLSMVVAADRAGRGAVVRRGQAGLLRRAEPGPLGPLLLEARRSTRGVALQVWGPAATPSASVEAALRAAAGWAGLHDDVDGFAAVARRHPVLRHVVRRLGEPRLSRMPRLAEALGRAVLEQLVQAAEARRSIADVAALVGTRATSELWCWPAPQQLGAVPAWTLRRCGVSLRGARALHAAAVADAALERDRATAEDGHGWEALDRRLRTLPGVGAWTSAEVRLRLGDADAVSVGDYHLPDVVGHALRGAAGDGPNGRWTDAAMLELLAPFAGHRGRVIRLLEAAAARGLVPARARRAPRAALSAHRYW